MKRAPRRDSNADAFDLRKAREKYDDYVRSAMEHHAQTGEWPPDPLLDEVHEMRRRVEAEHGDDPRKVLEWYIEAGNRLVAQNGTGAKAEKQHHAA
jgi:hypothetical protein